ncbi:hypothetical protein B0A52_02819 [Exophiala mesophila]|uniref:SWR1-complex protein 3 domain-containing protein n=1 Tax=Exophiala mesophila TaxID=212818 RepID=A0A438NE30_EXOME|nr:hypothetical protein B0A52_02819 [Exophiala mesophila]
MVDPGFQKRQLPPRERREAANKRSATSPATPVPSSKRKRPSQLRVESPAAQSPVPEPPVEKDVLPTKITSGQPLPTTAHPQDTPLSSQEYQSIAESAVLATSLHQSRMRWLCDGVFKKYWVKPVKKKGVEIPADNPDVKSMNKLGAATIIIEPHTFEAVFYTVRDPTAPPIPFQRHANQHTTKALLSPLPKASPKYPSQPGPYRPNPPQQPTNIKPISSSNPVPVAPQQLPPQKIPVANLPPSPVASTPTTKPPTMAAPAPAPAAPGPAPPPAPQDLHPPPTQQPQVINGPYMNPTQNPVVISQTTTTRVSPVPPPPMGPTGPVSNSSPNFTDMQPPVGSVQAPPGAQPPPQHQQPIPPVSTNSALESAQHAGANSKASGTWPQTPKLAPVGNPPTVEHVPKADMSPKPFAPPTPAPVPQDSRTPTPMDKPASTSNRPAGTGDPVIQMLAARAASSPRLKDLMKVVATSKASSEQLKEFQSHIDEINDLIRRQESDRTITRDDPPARTGLGAHGSPQLDRTNEGKPNSPAPMQTSTPQRAPTTQAPPPTNVKPPPPMHKPPPPPPRQQPSPSGMSALPGVMHTFSRPLPAKPSGNGPGRPSSAYMGYSTPPRPEPVVKHVILELTSAPSGAQGPCQDRWLFPEYAVLEIRPSGLEMVCSFLVERKGSELVGDKNDASGEDVRPRFDKDKDYFQPVTLTIKVTNHKTIATIAQAAKPLPAVQEYLKQVLATKERAPVVYLAHQLPREDDGTKEGDKEAESGFEDSGVELGADSAGEEQEEEEEEIRDLYGIV